jgi:hypothetical protein
MDLAGRLGLWVVLGSTHPLTGLHKPHNCLYLIDARRPNRRPLRQAFGTPGDLEYYNAG